MGQIARRHWLPACLIEEVAEADGPPVAVRLLGEDLVIFRDTDGRVGLLDRHCAAPPRLARCSGATRNADCAACTTAGSSTSTGNVLEMSSETGGQPDEGQGPAQGLSDARVGRRRLDLHGPRAGWTPRLPAAVVGAAGRDQDPASRRSCPVQLGADPRRRDRFGAQLDPALVRHGAGAGRRAPRRPRRTGCVRRPTRRRASPSSAPVTASGTRRCAVRSSTRRTTSTCG